MPFHTVKNRRFVREPLEVKSVFEVPGVGPTIGGRLCRSGICTARQLFLKYRENPQKLRDTLKLHGANFSHQQTAYIAMRDYAKHHRQRLEKLEQKEAQILKKEQKELDKEQEELEEEQEEIKKEQEELEKKQSDTLIEIAKEQSEADFK